MEAGLILIVRSDPHPCRRYDTIVTSRVDRVFQLERLVACGPKVAKSQYGFKPLSGRDFSTVSWSADGMAPSSGALSAPYRCSYWAIHARWSRSSTGAEVRSSTCDITRLCLMLTPTAAVGGGKATVAEADGAGGGGVLSATASAKKV